MGGGGFNYAAFFASGQSGFADDVTLANVFADTAATTPASVNGRVAAFVPAVGGYTFTQATEASRLWLRGTPQGGNLLDVGGLFLDPSDWTLAGSGATITDGVLVCTTATGTASFALPAISGKTYHVAMALTRSAGTIKAVHGGADGRVFSYGGPRECWITATGTGNFTLDYSGFTGSVTQVRVWAADADDVAAPYFFAGEGAQWIEAANSGIDSYPLVIAGKVAQYAETGEGGLLAAYESFDDAKILTQSRALDWAPGNLVSAYTGGTAQSVMHGLIADYANPMLAEGDHIAGGAAANPNSFGTKTSLVIGRGRPDIWYVDGRIESVFMREGALSADERSRLQEHYNAHGCAQAWGDSMTAGSDVPGPFAYPSRLQIAIGRQVENKGAGGETSEQIKDRFLADTSDRKQWLQLLCMGTNDEAYVAGNWNATFANIDACIADLPEDSRWLVMPPYRVTGSGNTKELLEAFDAEAATKYGDRFYNVRAYLQGFGDGGVDDTADIAAGAVPRSLRIADGNIHHNQRGNMLKARGIRSKLLAMGWL